MKQLLEIGCTWKRLAFGPARTLVLRCALAFLAGPVTAVTAADRPPTVSIAAAANLVYAMEALNAAFQRSEPGAVVNSASGSSGNLFAQIKSGAPFDLFLSADTEYPEQIVAANLGVPSTLRVFARGRLVVWTLRPDLDLADLAAAIRSPSVRKVAIAQPRTAPYGRAAEAALQHVGAWREAAPKLVLGENITQTAQFVDTGNAELGLVAMSLVLSPTLARKGRWKEIPPDWYRSVTLDHAVVLTKRGADNPVAQRYLAFLQSDAAKKILRDFGYGVP